MAPDGDEQTVRGTIWIRHRLATLVDQPALRIAA